MSYVRTRGSGAFSMQQRARYSPYRGPYGSEDEQCLTPPLSPAQHMGLLSPAHHMLLHPEEEQITPPHSPFMQHKPSAIVATAATAVLITPPVPTLAQPARPAKRKAAPEHLLQSETQRGQHVLLSQKDRQDAEARLLQEQLESKHQRVALLYEQVAKRRLQQCMSFLALSDLCSAWQVNSEWQHAISGLTSAQPSEGVVPNLFSSDELNNMCRSTLRHFVTHLSTFCCLTFGQINKLSHHLQNLRFLCVSIEEEDATRIHLPSNRLPASMRHLRINTVTCDISTVWLRSLHISNTQALQSLHFRIDSHMLGTGQLDTRLLWLCQQLEELELHNVCVNQQSLFFAIQHKLPRLKRLSLDDGSWYDHEHTFTHVTLGLVRRVLSYTVQHFELSKCPLRFDEQMVLRMCTTLPALTSWNAPYMDASGQRALAKRIPATARIEFC